MAIVVRNTNYNGEVLEKILVLATTGNDLVEKGLIMVIPGGEKKISLPRFALFLKQKRGLLFANLFFILILPYVLLLIKLRPIELEKIRSIAIQ